MGDLLVFETDVDRVFGVDPDEVDRRGQFVVDAGYDYHVETQARPFTGSGGGIALGDQTQRAIGLPITRK